MTADSRDTLPIVGPPLEWPALPDPFTFSALLVLRQCARRWSFTRARFVPGGLFDEGGRLQERASWGAVRGRIVHKTLEALLEIHRRELGPAAGSWGLVPFWKRHLPAGGVPALVAMCTDDELASVDEIGRNRLITPWLRQRSVQEAGEIVASVNAKLGVALAHSPAVPARGASHQDRRPRARPLGIGTHPEVSVSATLCGPSGTRRWRGVIDVAQLRETSVSFVDYKGGTEELSHREQLELYALLFARDPIANPSGRRASELVLAYDNGRTVVWAAPDDAALAELESRLMDEVEGLARETNTRPPEARPATTACSHCPGRALCDEYWSRPEEAGSPETPSAEGYIDLELRAESVSGSGDELIGIVIRSNRRGISSRVRVLNSAVRREQARSVAPNDIIRILGAQEIKADIEAQETDNVVILGGFAEIVLVRPP